jgi:nitrate reductase gamma subunit
VFELLMIAGGFLLGVAVGRWYVLVVPLACGVWLAVVSEVDEVPAWFLGLAYGALLALGMTGGILLRRALRNRRD